MTIKQVSAKLFGLAVDGFFNGEQFTKRELEDFIANSFRSEASLKLGHQLAMEIALPDGRWLFTITHYDPSADGFDFFIPETREQESRLWARLTT